MSTSPLCDQQRPAPADAAPGATPPLTLSVLRRVVASARAVMQADAALLLLYEPETDRFVPVVPSVAVGLGTSQSLAQQSDHHLRHSPAL